MNTFEEILTEPISKYLGDSGRTYGYIYEKNRENGILKGYQECDFYRDDENKECELYPTIPLYDFLKYNCLETYWSNSIQEMIENKAKENNISMYNIQKIEKICQDLFNDDGITNIKWKNTYNYDNKLSQNIQFLTFNYEGLDYVLLQIHNGCDIRSGYTYPQVFELNDIEYFFMGTNDCNIECKCLNMSLTMYDYNEYYDSDGDIDKYDIYERTYVDNDGKLRCKECNAIIKSGFMEY